MDELKIREALPKSPNRQSYGSSFKPEFGSPSIAGRSFNHLDTPKFSGRTARNEKPGLDAFIDGSRDAHNTPPLRKVALKSLRTSPQSTEASTESSNIAQGWKHLRRHIPQTETDAGTSIDLDRRSRLENTQNYRWTAERVRLKESRRARFEQTRDGKFVALGTAVQQNAPESLGSQEKRVSWRSNVSNASQATESPPYSLDNASDWSKRWNSPPAPGYPKMADDSSQNNLSPFGKMRIRKHFGKSYGGDINPSVENPSDTAKHSSQVDVPDIVKSTSRFKEWTWTQSTEEHSTVTKETPSFSTSRSPAIRFTSTPEALSTEASSPPGATRFTSTSKFTKYDDRTPNSSYLRETMRHKDRSNRRLNRAKKQNNDNDNDYDDDETGRIERIRKKISRKKSRAPKQINLPEFITVSNLATVLKVKAEDFGRRLRALGFEATHNDIILDAETAGLIAAEFNFEPVVNTGGSNELVARPPAIDVSILPARPPVVTIMGHVDHGKTTLLDWLRKSSVAASEHGGITQHIGAFSVSMPGGRLITFLDTPGHAAFLNMRQRGANVTDIVILVVAADDSVKPQTVEAIKHARAAKVPMIVAVSKIDKEEANVERVKHDLARHGLEIEDFGGDTQVVCISGKTGQGMAELEDAAIALADILDLRAETDGQAEGRILESTTNKGGRIATVLVQRSTITCGDVLVAGLTWAKVRSLRNEAGAQVTVAGPGTPVEIDGWKDQPAAGDEVLQAPDEQTAKSVIEHRIELQKSSKMAADMVAINEARRIEQEKRELEKRKLREINKAVAAAEALAKAAGSTGRAVASARARARIEVEEAHAAGSVGVAGAAGGRTVTPASEALTPEPSQPGVKEVLFVIKADVSGSVEAVLNSVSALGNSEVYAHVLRSGVGPLTEFDIEHAATVKGHIICFNVTVEPKMAHMAEAAGVKILDSRIIYSLVDDVKAMLSEQLAPIITQKVLGEAEVAQIFEITTKNKVTVPVAGCKVRNGVLDRNKKVKLLRGREIIYDGKLFPSFSHFSLTPAYEHMMILGRITNLVETVLGTMSSLKIVKKDVTEVRKDSDCGISFENWTDIRIGDQVQSYEDDVQKRSL